MLLLSISLSLENVKIHILKKLQNDLAISRGLICLKNRPQGEEYFIQYTITYSPLYY
jgi:hypothetical protein